MGELHPSKFAGKSTGNASATGALSDWSVAEFRRLLDTLSAGAYMCDPEGLITYFNQRAVTIWGRTPRLNHPDDRYCGSYRQFTPDGTAIPHDQSWMALTLQTNTDYNGQEIIIEQKDGRRLTVLSHANPILNDSGALIGAVNVLMDISERKAVEEEQRRMRRVLAQMRRQSLGGEMAAGIAHEINQPLTAILNYCEVCMSLLRADNPDSCDIITALGEIKEQGMLAGKVIRRLRDFTARTTLNQVPVDIDKVIREAISIEAGEVRKRASHVRVDTREPLPQLSIDSIQIQQVLVNLIQNSLEAMDAPESETRELTVRAESADEGWATISVIDTGPGLASEVIDRLFYPFVTTKVGGMGLGLSISQSIIEAHGGRLWVESESGSGTAFHFSLPLARNAGDPRSRKSIG